MVRVCPGCGKKTDFKIKSIKDMDSLVCPYCGANVPSAKPPADSSAEENDTGTKIGGFIGKLFHLSFIFYMVVATAGIIFYFLKFDIALYIAAGIDVGVYIIQYICGFNTFRFGFLFLGLGAIAGFLIFKTPQGICLMVLAVFFIRHLIREVIYRIVWAIIRWARSC